MPNENFESPRRNALPGLSTVSVTSAGGGTGTTAFVSEEESARFLASEPDLYGDYMRAVTQGERGSETGAAVHGDGKATISFHHGELVAFPDDSPDHVSHANPTTVVGLSGGPGTTNSLIGIPGFDSSAGRAPRRPELAGPGRLGRGLPLTAGNLLLQTND